jgi:hypothetical protein
VCLNHVPNWLRLAWLRARPGQRHYRGGTAGWEVFTEVNEVLTAAGHPGLDHWGSTQVGGKLCFVTEPYQDVPTVAAEMQYLASIVGGTPTASRESDWGHGTVRGLLVPPDEAAPPSGAEARALAVAWRTQCRQRQCCVCLEPVAEGRGTYWATLRAFTHQGGCAQLVERCDRDTSRSPRGRRRSRSAWRREIERLRE